MKSLTTLTKYFFTWLMIPLGTILIGIGCASSDESNQADEIANLKELILKEQEASEPVKIEIALKEAKKEESVNEAPIVEAPTTTQETSSSCSVNPLQMATSMMPNIPTECDPGLLHPYGTNPYGLYGYDYPLEYIYPDLVFDDLFYGDRYFRRHHEDDDHHHDRDDDDDDNDEEEEEEV